MAFIKLPSFSSFRPLMEDIDRDGKSHFREQSPGQMGQVCLPCYHPCVGLHKLRPAQIFSCCLTMVLLETSKDIASFLLLEFIDLSMEPCIKTRAPVSASQI